MFKQWVVLILVLILVLFGGGIYMYQEQWKMTVFVTPDSENDPEWPNKKLWFDASQWLKTTQYIKIDNFHLLNVKYAPIAKVNDFLIILTLQEAIKKSLNLEPKLLPLAKMDNQNFFNYMKGNISYEYLRTEFDSETLTPVNDYFLLLFTHKGQDYEVQLLREPYEDGFSFPYAGFVHKAGYWHATSPAEYSYRDYLEGKPVK